MSVREQRLQKVLAGAGVASRRRAEQLVLEGRVRVNGRVVSKLGTKVDPHRSRIEVDGRRVAVAVRIYLVLNKPREVMTTLSDPQRRKTVWDLVRSVGTRVVPVGRLDYHTSGVLLLTNDGEFQSVLTHPRGGVERTYVAKVRGTLDETALDSWRQASVVEGRSIGPAKVRVLRHEHGKTWLEVTLREGRNRQIRRLGEAAGTPVLRLSRIAFAGITGEGLRPGQWRHLTKDELSRMKKAYGVPLRVQAAAKQTSGRRSRQ